MKKVLVLSLAYYPHVGGAEVAIKEIADRISDIEFHLITLQFGGAPRCEQLGNVEVHRIGFDGSYLSKIFFAPLAAVKAYSLHREHNFNAMWAMMSYMLFPIVLLRLFGVRLPYVLTLQEGDTEAHMFGRLRILPFFPMLRSGFKHASIVTVLSTHLAQWARRMGYRGEIEIVPNGADVQKFAGNKITHEGAVLITSSRLVHKNAVDVILRALALLPRDVRLVIAGTGPKESALKSLARSLGVEERIEWRGHVGHAQLAALLHAADIFVRPSRSEGFGVSFVEAMAAELPVIATQEGGIADFLFDAKRNPEKPTTGWAVDKNSPEGVAEAVKDILAHSEQMKQVVANAQKLVRSKYDWSIIAHDMRKKVFARVL